VENHPPFQQSLWRRKVLPFLEKFPFSTKAAPYCFFL